MLEDIHDDINSHPSVNRRGTHYKIRDRITQIQTEWKEAVLSTQNMGKGLHNFFKGCHKWYLTSFTNLDKSGSEVSYSTPKTRNVAELTRLSDDIHKPWIK